MRWHTIIACLSLVSPLSDSAVSVDSQSSNMMVVTLSFIMLPSNVKKNGTVLRFMYDYPYRIEHETVRSERCSLRVAMLSFLLFCNSRPHPGLRGRDQLLSRVGRTEYSVRRE